jgi:hypothetical protein
LITPSEILNKIETLRNTIGQIPTEKNPSIDILPVNTEKENTLDQETLDNVIAAIGKKHLSLGSSLHKIVSFKLELNQLNLFFNPNDRFAADLVTKDKEFIEEQLTNTLNAPIKIKISFISDNKTVKSKKKDPDEELLKKIFRGKTVGGE